VSLPCGVASGALLGTDSCAGVAPDGVALACSAGWDVGALAGVGWAEAACGRASATGAAGLVIAGIVGLGSSIDGAGRGAAGAFALPSGTGLNCGSANWMVGAWICGRSRATVGVAGPSWGVRLMLGAACAGNGTGSTCGVAGGAAGWVRTSTTGLGGCAMGGAIWSSAMLGAGTGGAAWAGTAGIASEGGESIGRLPSACGLRTGSGWKRGGTGRALGGVSKLIWGGEPASGTGASCGAGCGCGTASDGVGAAGAAIRTVACGAATAMTGVAGAATVGTGGTVLGVWAATCARLPR
jgi:hypothetical protein